MTAEEMRGNVVGALSWARRHWVGLVMIVVTAACLIFRVVVLDMSLGLVWVFLATMGVVLCIWYVKRHWRH